MNHEDTAGSPRLDSVDVMQDQLFRALVEHARDIVLLMTVEGDLVFANAAAEAAYGYSRQEFIGLHIRDLRAPDTHVGLTSDMKRAAGPGVLFETVHVDRTGRTFPVEVSSREITLDGERYLLSFIRDISMRLERLAERESLLQDLAVANRQLEGLLSVVSRTVGQLDLDTLLGDVMVALNEVMSADATMLFIAEGDELVLRSFDGLSADAIGFRMGVGEGFAGRVAGAGEPLWTPDVTGSATSVWMHGHYGMKAMFGMPLRFDGRLFGVLECAWTSHRLVSEAERVMLQVAADRVMSAIVGAQRHERTARAQRLDAALHVSADRLSASHEVRANMPSALQVAAEALGCDVAAFGSYRDGVWRAVYCIGELPAGTSIDVPRHPERSATPKEAVPVVRIDAATPSGHWLSGALGLAEALVAPVVLGGEWVGAAVFGRREPGDGFDDLAIGFVRRLSGSMSLALANAHEYDSEHRIAETLQESLLRVDESCVPVPFGHLYHAATAATKVGGDFYDAFTMADGRIGFIVGDVSGKGLDAAVFTSLVKATVRAFAHEEPSPSTAVAKANRVLSSTGRLPDFASLMLLYLDPATGEITYCCAGNPPGILRKASGGIVLLFCDSPVVGAFCELTYAEKTETLEPGDVLVLYTDGATDARGAGGEFFGEERLIEAVSRSTAPADRLAAELHSVIMAFSDGVTSDDIAIVTVGLPARETR